MPVGRKNAAKFATPMTLKSQHDDQNRGNRAHGGPMCLGEDADATTISYIHHSVFPELPQTQGELFFECTLFLYSVLAMFLQYINLYKTMWWLPHSHVHYSLKFHMIDLYLLSCVGLILGRRVTLCFLKKITLVPPGCDPDSAPFYIHVIEWCIKLPAVAAIMTSFSFSFLQVLSSYSWSSLIYVVYPVLFYVLLFYNELFFIFVDAAPSHSPRSNFLKRLTSYACGPPYYVEPSTSHACSNSANGVREEADILIVDFYQRFKQSLFAAFTTSYYAVFLPCCFSPHYLYVDYWWSFEMCCVVFSTSWTIYIAYLFPLHYCDLLHRSAQHLGAWEKLERQPAHVMQLPINLWSEHCIWSDGSIVKQGRSLFRAHGSCVAAEPSNSDHARFYLLLKDPLLLINGICLAQACLIFCQFLMLVHSTEWQHIMTLVLLMFANYLLLFKSFKDKIILGRIYNPNLEELGLKKLR